MSWRRTFASAALCACVALFSCQNEQDRKKRVYYPRLKAPIGIAVEVIDDVSMDRVSGATINIFAVVDADIDRDELDRLMRSFYRQAHARRKFRGHRSAESIELTFLSSDDRNKTSGTWLGKVVRGPMDERPTFENRQKPPLLKWVKDALGKLPQYSGEIKPKFLVNTETMRVDITLPLVKLDGSGAYVDTPTFQRATTAFSSTTMVVFKKIEVLEYLTFRATHREKELLRVQLSRRQFTQINLAQVEESLGELRGQLIEQTIARRTTDEKMQKELSKRRKRLYDEVFSVLPKENVYVDSSLK